MPNLVPTSGRGTLKAKVNLPKGAKNAIAILTENKRNFQDNVFDHKSKQYWAEIENDGAVIIPRVAAGKYRLTVSKLSGTIWIYPFRLGMTCLSIQSYSFDAH